MVCEENYFFDSLKCLIHRRLLALDEILFSGEVRGEQKESISFVRIKSDKDKLGTYHTVK